MEQTVRLLSRKEESVSRRYKLPDDSVAVVARVISQRLPEIHITDFEDLIQTALTGIVERLHGTCDENGCLQIENVSNYAASVAHNACNDFIREKSPVRMRLKQNLRDLFTRYPELSCWKKGQVTLCGFKEWTGHPLPIGTSEKIAGYYERRETGENISFNNVSEKESLHTVVTAILNWLNAPIAFNDLVSLVADISGYAEQTYISLENETTALCREDLKMIDAVEAEGVRYLLRRIWEILQGRSLNQRRTFLYTVTDENGCSLLQRVFEERVATVDELTLSLEISFEHLLELFKRTPLDLDSAAIELGESKSNISKWKYRATESLWDELSKRE